jgi:hypothetical protein
MSCKAKGLIAMVVATVSIAAIPALQAINPIEATPLACQGGGSGCAG